MSLAGTIKPGDWNSVRRAIHKLSYLKLGPTAAPTFEGLTLTGLTASRLAATDADVNLVSTDLYSWVAETANQVLIADEGDGTVTFSTPQDIHTGASPTFIGLTLTGILTTDEINYTTQLDIDKIGTGTVIRITSTGTTAQIAVLGTNDLILGAGDDLILRPDGSIYLQPGGDTDDYIKIDTIGNVPQITTVGGCDLKILAASKLIDFVDTNLKTTGTVTADDYVLAITDSDSGQILQNGTRILHTYVPSDQSPTWANIFIGENAGNFTITNPTSAYEGTGNIGIGADTLDALTTGYYNFAMGTNSGTDLTSGFNNILIGHQAGANITDGDDNFLFGRDCGAFITTGYRNVGIGTNVLRGSTPASAGMNQNVAIGYKSGYGLTGNSNIFIGLYSGYRQTAISGRLIIDNALRADAATEITNAIIYGVMAATPANQILRINAALNVAGAATIGDGGTTNYTAFAADGELTQFGTARVLKEIIIGSGDFHKGVSAPDDVYMSNNIHVLAFDKTTVEHGHYETIIPMDFAAGTTINVEVDWAFDTAEADHYMTWVMEYVLIADGEDPAGAITRTYQKSVVSTGNNDKQIHTTFGTGITGAVADDTLLIRFFRDSDATYDTDDLDQDAWLLTVHLHYISDKLGEAT